MDEKILDVRLIQKNDTKANWIANNPILLEGELGYESDTEEIKFGSNNEQWNTRPYYGVNKEDKQNKTTNIRSISSADDVRYPTEKAVREAIDSEIGDDGWTPLLVIVSDGEREVLKVQDWLGGTGAKPTVDVYIGSSGYVSNIAQAVNIRGAKGDIGITGSTGAVGATGATGTKGDDGYTPKLVLTTEAYIVSLSTANPQDIYYVEV